VGSPPGCAVVRDAAPADAAACLAIYAPYVTGSSITFEYDPPSEDEMAGRIARAVRTHAWLVLEVGGRVVGYAYAGPVKERAAYAWSCEVSVYLEHGRGGRGEGRQLYEALFERLGARGYRRAIAGMTMPNEASSRLHRALGFEPIGVQRRIGWKHGAWRDVAWVQRDLGDAPGDRPPEAVGGSDPRPTPSPLRQSPLGSPG
jgi:L-amino acid N-acyltransferase YncA